MAGNSEDLVVNIKAKLDQAKKDVAKFQSDLEKAKLEQTIRVNVDARQAQAELDDVVGDQEVEITAEVDGTEEVEALAEAAEAVEDKDVDVAADVAGAEDVEDLASTIDDVDDKSVEVEAEVDGGDDVADLAEIVDELDDKDVTVEAEVDGQGDVEDLGSAVDNLEDKTVQVTVETSGAEQASDGLDAANSKAGALAGVMQGLAARLSGAGAGAKAAAGEFSGMAGSFGTLSTGALAAGGGIAAAGVAAYQAIKSIQDLSIEAGQLADATGLSTESASRFIEVAGEMGVEAGTLESIFGRLNKNIDPELFASLGIEIARAANGTVDAQQTFLNVIDRLNGIEDASERAQIGAQIFGRGWQSIAELVGEGADNIKEKLAGVEDEKVISPEAVANARALRGTMDELSDAADDVLLTLGRALLPAIKSLAPAITDLVKSATPLVGALGDIIELGTKLGAFKLPDLSGSKAAVESAKDYKTLRQEFIEGKLTAEQYADAVDDDFATSVRAAGGEILDLSAVVSRSRDVMDESKQAALDAAGGVDTLAQSQADAATAADNAAFSAAAYATALQTQNAQLAIAEESMQKVADLYQGLINGSLSAADSQIVAQDAQTKFFDAVAATNDAFAKQGETAAAASKAVAEHGAASEEAAKANDAAAKATDDVAKATNAERDAAIDAAKALGDLRDRQAEANGVTVSAVEKIDNFNSSLLDQAQNATPAARGAIADYILTANNVPAEKGTAIKAAIEAGDFETAANLLKDLSKTREAAVNVTANTGAAENAIQQLIRTRNMTVNAQIVARGGAGYGADVNGRLATGGTTRKGGLYEVTEGGQSELLHEGGKTYLLAGAAGEVQPIDNSNRYVGGDTPFPITPSVGSEPTQHTAPPLTVIDDMFYQRRVAGNSTLDDMFAALGNAWTPAGDTYNMYLTVTGLPSEAEMAQFLARMKRHGYQT